MTTLLYAIEPIGCENISVPNAEVKSKLARVPASIPHGVGHCSTFGYTVFEATLDGRQIYVKPNDAISGTISGTYHTLFMGLSCVEYNNMNSIMYSSLTKKG